jgi:hypothetical protein
MIEIDSDLIVFFLRFDHHRGRRSFRDRSCCPPPEGLCKNAALRLNMNITLEITMANAKQDTRNWPDLAIGLYDKLTGRGAEITYEFNDFELMVPSKAGGNAEYAHWKMNGALKIRTSDNGNA